MLISIVVVAAIYMSMNLAFIGVVPWQETLKPKARMANKNIAGAFMTKLYGERAATAFTVADHLDLPGRIVRDDARLLADSVRRGKERRLFPFFAALHPTRGYPWASLALLSAMTAFFCFFPLEIVIQGAVTVRIVIQFIGQIFALHVVRRERAHPLPFRMWLYPLPSLIALVGWIFLLSTSEWISSVCCSSSTAVGCWFTSFAIKLCRSAAASSQ